MSAQGQQQVWIQIAGRKNSGKTKLVTDLVEALTRQKLKVASVKHSSHRHPVDIPGKDSWKHRQAGTTATALISDSEAGVFFTLDREATLQEQLQSFFTGADIVLVESGGAVLELPTFELWRSQCEELPLALESNRISWLICDDQLPEGISLPVLSRRDLKAVLAIIRGELHKNG
jgi:molybdopterin-guanine dinucleotide biosynthesis protein B